MNTLSKEKITSLPPVTKRRIVHFINPKSASSRNYASACRAVENIGGEMMVSSHAGHISEMISELFNRDPYAHAVVYGGDGTVYEAVNGIMLSGHSDTASFSVVPSGSGNDFSSYANDSGDFEKGEYKRIDLIRTTADKNVRYSANMMNVGFDCDVVWETYSLKKNPLFKGSASYIAGVVKALGEKKVIPAELTMSGVTSCDGEMLDDVTVKKKILLTAFANSRCYGGGFKAAPLASLTDGLCDVVVIGDVTRAKFVSAIGHYRKGDYINEHGVLIPPFRKFLAYYKCKKFTLKGPSRFCIDGEIFDLEQKTVEGEVIPEAVWFAAL